MSISIFKFDVGQMVCGREGEYVRRDDHERELAAKDEEIERLKESEERSHLQTIDQRDAAENAISQAYFLVKGESPEWSNLFGYDEALEEISDALKCLRISVSNLEAENASLKAQVERLSAPVSYEEKSQFALHYVRLVQPDRQEPAMLVQNVNRFIAARAGKEKP